MYRRFIVAAAGNRYIIIDTAKNEMVKDSLCHNMSTARVIARSMNSNPRAVEESLRLYDGYDDYHSDGSEYRQEQYDQWRDFTKNEY